MNGTEDYGTFITVLAVAVIFEPILEVFWELLRYFNQSTFSSLDLQSSDDLRSRSRNKVCNN